MQKNYNRISVAVKKDRANNTGIIRTSGSFRRKPFNNLTLRSCYVSIHIHYVNLQ